MADLLVVGAVIVFVAAMLGMTRALAFLARHAGKVCTRRMILENVWGLDTRTK
jgi:DNA-binding winged helix-turn-helix (wHTH) protein